MSVEDDERELDRLLQATAITPAEHALLRGGVRRGASTAQLEAIRLVAEWCKWCTTVEVAMIAAIGAFFRADNVEWSHWVIGPSVAAVACFVFSIALAAAVFSSLPEATQDIH